MEETNEPKTATIEQVVDKQLADIPLAVELATVGDELVALDYKAEHEAKLKMLEAEADALPPITDKASLELNQKMLTRLVSIRGELNDSRLAITKPFADLKKKVDAYIGTTVDSGLLARVKAMEIPIEERKREWNDAQELIRQQALKAIQDRNRERGRYLVDEGMRFDGAMYLLGDVKIFQSDVFALNDEGWAKWTAETLKPAADKQREVVKVYHGRVEQLVAIGMTWRELPTGRFLIIGDNETGVWIPEASLRGMSDDEFMSASALATAVRDKAIEDKRAEDEKIRLKAEEDTRMKKLFEEQQERQKKMDEDRAALDREREQLRKDKQQLRHNTLIGLGAEYDEDRKMYHVGWDMAQVVPDLAGLSDEDWKLAMEAVSREWHKLQEITGRNKLMFERSAVLQEMEVRYDGESIWTLGEEVTTDLLLGTMPEEEWVKVLDGFKRAVEAKRSAQEPTLEPGEFIPHFTDAELDGMTVAAPMVDGTIDADERRLLGLVADIDSLVVLIASAHAATEQDWVKEKLATMKTSIDVLRIEAHELHMAVSKACIEF